MSRSTSTRTIYVVAEYDRFNSPVRQLAYDSDEDPSEHWDSDLQRDVDDTATTPAPVEPEPAEHHRTTTPPPPSPATVIASPTQQGPYRRQTTRIRVVDFPQGTYPTSQVPPLHSSQPASATYHLGGTSSMEPYVTTTRASDRYTWQGHMDQYMIATVSL
ncbi:hypothetical protein Tco_1270184 [Tanacetum coccineum]